MLKYRIVFFVLLGTFCIRSFAMSLMLESPVIKDNTILQAQYTCDGADVSPPLRWHDPTEITKTYVLILDDPDATRGMWAHWVLFNIPANVQQLDEGAPTPDGAVSGRNDWGTTGYRGPCPPTGNHRYHYRLYALDTVLDLDETATREDVMRAMQKHILAQTELTVLFHKK